MNLSYIMWHFPKIESTRVEAWRLSDLSLRLLTISQSSWTPFICKMHISPKNKQNLLMSMKSTYLSSRILIFTKCFWTSWSRKSRERLWYRFQSLLRCLSDRQWRRWCTNLSLFSQFLRGLSMCSLLSRECRLLQDLFMYKKLLSNPLWLKSSRVPLDPSQPLLPPPSLWSKR